MAGNATTTTITAKAQDVVTIERTKLMKTASAIKRAVEERDKVREKLAGVSEESERFRDNLNRLFKLAAADHIGYDAIPELLEKLASMDKEEQSLELRALEKAASRQLLSYGDLGEKTASGEMSDNPLVDFVIKHSGGY